jgi:hypothetical protein
LILCCAFQSDNLQDFKYAVFELYVPFEYKNESRLLAAQQDLKVATDALHQAEEEIKELADVKAHKDGEQQQRPSTNFSRLTKAEGLVLCLRALAYSLYFSIQTHRTTGHSCL